MLPWRALPLPFCFHGFLPPPLTSDLTFVLAWLWRIKTNISHVISGLWSWSQPWFSQLTLTDVKHSLSFRKHRLFHWTWWLSAYSVVSIIMVQLNVNFLFWKCFDFLQGWTLTCGSPEGQVVFLVIHFQVWSKLFPLLCLWPENWWIKTFKPMKKCYFWSCVKLSWKKIIWGEKQWFFIYFF